MPAVSAAAPSRHPAPSRPGQARLVIRLLGEAVATLDGQPLPEITAPRMQQLLARVILASDAGVPRERLAWELWPESSEAQARTNLRKLIHDLRRSLPAPGEFLDVGPRTVRWCSASSAWVDVVAFTHAVTSGDPAGAIRVYRGDLAPDCDSDWIGAERERLRRLAVEALATLATATECERRDSDTIEHTRHLLRIDALHEQACRQLMRALARRGERSEALRTYDRLVARLARDLGVTPEPATVALAERFRGSTGSGPTGHARARPAMVGRADGWRCALAAWREAAGGCARMLLVTGEAGIGKSRLVEELARRVATDGHAVAYGRGYEAVGMPPWGPVIEWLRSEPVHSGLAALDDVWLTELTRLLPELRTEHPGLPDAPPGTDGTRRHHLLDAVRRGLLARRRPLLLVVDDLQWCDTDTVELCGYLVQSSPSAPVLIAGTARDDAVSAQHPLARLRSRLAAAGTVSGIALGCLGPRATAEMAKLVGARALDAGTAARLWEETEGNPLFVAEAVRAGFGTAAASGRRLALTPTVHAVITARLDRLSPGARRLAEVAATIGREFTTEVLATAAGRTEDDLTGDLDELWQHHIVRDRGPAYDFSHDRLRDVALELIAPARRRSLHRCVADAIEEHHAGDPGPASARLAAHYTAAGLGARAVAAYERAAEHAYRVFALDDGIALLERALRLLGESPRSRARDEIELRLRSAIGVPLVARRGYGAPEVQHSYERALTLHRRLGSRPSPAVLRGLALHAVGTCGFDRAEELGRDLVAVDDDRTAGVEGEYVLGVTGFWRGEFAEAERHLVAAIDGYRVEDAPLHIARYAQDPKAVCLSRLALTRLFRGRPAEASMTMRTALRVATELDHPMTTGYVRAFDTMCAVFEPRDLHATVAALDAVTSTMRIGYFATIARLLGAWRDVLDGDLRGIDTIRGAADRLRREQPLHLTFGLSLLARSHLLAGDAEAGRSVITEAVDRTGRSGQRYLLAELLRIDAELHALAGDPAAAIRTAHDAVHVADRMGAPLLRDRALATLARLPHG